VLYHYNRLFERYPVLEGCRDQVMQAYEILRDSYNQDGKLLVGGNGGSCADSEHIVGELMKGFLKKRPLAAADVEKWSGFEGGAEMAKGLQGGIQAISLPSQVALLSAVCNDNDPATLYAQLAWNYAREKDVLIGISTSGNAKNVLGAAQAAKARGAAVVGLTGMKESKLSAVADVTIRVPDTETYRIQEYHLPVYHWLCALVEEAVFAE
jgi:D-sedoheptulose 7-phosphate isomerase